MNLLQAQQLLTKNLGSIYDERETGAISSWVLEDLTGLTKSGRMVHREDLLTEAQETLLESYIRQLLKHTPVQYVLGYAYFCGRKFFVDENVLIPRPETEELVNWVTGTMATMDASVSVLDIGTGSGIIPVSIKSAFPLAQISALDISPAALQAAERNSRLHHTKIQFIESDILHQKEWDKFTSFDIIVSNPPYIAQREKAQMESNVLEHEPGLALFVPDHAPLLFYENIASFARAHLNEEGRLFFEINESYGKEIVSLLQGNHFQHIEIRKDFQGKDRMVKCMFKK